MGKAGKRGGWRSKRTQQDASYYWQDHQSYGPDTQPRQPRKPQDKGPVFPKYDMMLVGDKKAKPDASGGQSGSSSGDFVKIVQKLTNNLRKAGSDSGSMQRRRPRSTSNGRAFRRASRTAL